jgi:hypothetical protein
MLGSGVLLVRENMVANVDDFFFLTPPSDFATRSAD